MKITMGIVSPDEAEELAGSEADEFYCGFAAARSHRCLEENFTSLSALGRAARIVHGRGKPLYLAANELYREKEYPRLLEILRQASAAGVDGVIMRDIGLMSFLAAKKYKTFFILSALGACFNASSLRLYASLGFSRVTLPENLAPSEAGGLLRNPLGLETEIFFPLSQFCRNFSSACFLYRCFDMPQPPDNEEWPCCFRFRSGGKRFEMPQPDTEGMLLMLHGFVRGGATCLKLPRTAAAAPGIKPELVRISADLARLAAKSPSGADFLKAVRRGYAPGGRPRRRPWPGIFEDNASLKEYLWNTL